MKKTDLVFNNVEKKDDTFIRQCLFDKFHEETYKKVMNHLRNAKDSKDFINKILEDSDLDNTQAYAEVSKRLKLSEHWHRVRNMFGVKCFKTISDAGSLKIGKEDLTILVPNGYGDGITRVAIFKPEDRFNDRMMNYFITIEGKDINIYSYDCGDNIAMTISGRYNIYFYEGLIAFVKTK